MILFLLYFIRIFKLCCFTCDNISLGTRKQKHGNFRTAQIFNIDQYPVFNVDSFFLHLYSRTLISIYILNVGHSSFLTSIKTKQKNSSLLYHGYLVCSYAHNAYNYNIFQFDSTCICSTQHDKLQSTGLLVKLEWNCREARLSPPDLERRSSFCQSYAHEAEVVV